MANKPKPKSTKTSSAQGSATSHSSGMASAKKGSSKSTGRASTRSSRKTVAPAPQESAISTWWRSLSAERKIDILGIVLAVAGLFSFLILLSKEHGVLTRWLVTAMRQTGGMGAFILPLGLMLVGVWLVLRKIERFPAPSGERLTGFILLYLNVLTILHLVAGGGWALADAGEGGGFLGAIFERLLVGAMGTGGAWVLLVAWFLLALVLTLDISMREIAGAVTSLTGRINQQMERERPPEQISAASSRERQAPVRGMLSTPVLEEEDDEHVSHELPPDFTPIAGSGSAQPVRANARPSRGRGAQAANPAAVSQSADATGPATAQVKTQRDPLWVMPKVEEILDPPTVESVKSNVEHERGRLIEETLASFGAPAHIVEISQGPTVTQFGVEPDFLETRNGRTRVRVSKIVSLADDLALALAAPRIRIQAPVPGRSYVGIEVPNAEISRVMMREVLESENFAKIRSTLRFALGKDVAGKPVAYDLAGMPHLLIAGTTGSGKSVCVNSILTALLLQNSPNELRMILVDPKRVELTGYNGIPHLLSPVVVDAERVIGALQWVQREMDARYHRFSQVGARNIVDYNKKNSPTLPYLLVLVDELADLMMLAPDETERSLTRLAQLARATGIHLVLATQRPSVDVVTGLIKANFPSRIAFAVASGIDSRVILDQPGAERLLGRGDMLFQAPDSPAPVRLQGVFVSDPEIQRLVDYWRLQDYNMRLNRPTPGQMDSTAEPVNMDLPVGTPLTQAPLFDGELGAKEGDPILEDAIKVVRQEGKASISMLQRKLRIGYTRAARLIDSMEEKGIVGPSLPTSQVREVLDMGDEIADE